MVNKVYLAVAAATMMFTAPAMAADYVVEEPAPVSSWTAFYIGAGAGAAWSNYDAHGRVCDAYYVCINDNFIDNLISNIDGDSAFRGIVQAGFDWEAIPGFVLGIQGDYNFGQELGFDQHNNYLDGSYDKASFNISDMWTLAGRFGWATDQTLFYGLAGWSWANTDLNLKYDCNSTDCVASFSNGDTLDGWTLGAGVEFKGWLWESASTRLEYRYTDLGGNSVSGYDLDYNHYKLDTDQSVQGIYLTVNWRFGGF